MSSSRPSPAARMPVARAPVERPPGEDDPVNERINALLRDAAERREARARAQAQEDAESARRRFEKVLALARGDRARPRR